MVTSYRGFTRFNQPRNTQMVGNSSSPLPPSKTLLDVIKSLEGVSTETVDRSKTIFFPGDPAERVYLIRRGAVRLSRVYETVLACPLGADRSVSGNGCGGAWLLLGDRQ